MPYHPPRGAELPGHLRQVLFVDYSSAFNTVTPDILVSKLSDLGLRPHPLMEDMVPALEALKCANLLSCLQILRYPYPTRTPSHSV